MCGRFALMEGADVLVPEFRLAETPAIAPHYNIAPTQPVAVVANRSERRIEMFRWGLVPSGAADLAVGNRMINARAESLAERPAFARPLRTQRCIVPASGFFEWKKDPIAGKTPHFIRRRDGKPMALAGLWDEWRAPDGTLVLSCTIVTTRPNGVVGELHDRMPAILPRDAYDRWLTPGAVEPPEIPALLALLGPAPDDVLEAYPVSHAVNKPENDVPACVEPADRAGPPPGQQRLF